MIQRSVFGEPLSRDEVEVSPNVDTRIDRKLKDFWLVLIPLIVGVVFGGIITAMWDLNAKINHVVGQEAVRAEISSIRKEKLSLLEQKIAELEKQNRELIAKNAEQSIKLDTMTNKATSLEAELRFDKKLNQASGLK